MQQKEGGEAGGKLESSGHRVRRALIGLLGIGLVGAVAVAMRRLRSIGTAATLMIATAAVMLPIASMTLAVLPAASLVLAALLFAPVTLAPIAPAKLVTAAIASLALGAAVIELVAVDIPVRPEPAAIGALARLAPRGTELRLCRHDDAVIVLGMLQIALPCDQIAGGQRIACERGVFLCNMRRGTADFHVGPIGLVASTQWILGLAASAAAAPAILLSLPHRLMFNPNKRHAPRPCSFNSKSMISPVDAPCALGRTRPMANLQRQAVCVQKYEPTLM
jgi:hypothetical protein